MQGATLLSCLISYMYILPPLLNLSGLKRQMSCIGKVQLCQLIIVPTEQSSLGDYETGSVCVCVRPGSKCWNLLLLCHFLADFDSVCLSDRAWCGLQNFYTEFWNSLCKFMQIYSKSMKNATSLFLGRFWFCLFYLIGLGGGFKTSTQNF